MRSYKSLSIINNIEFELIKSNFILSTFYCQHHHDQNIIEWWTFYQDPLCVLVTCLYPQMRYAINVWAKIEGNLSRHVLWPINHVWYGDTGTLYVYGEHCTAIKSLDKKFHAQYKWAILLCIHRTRGELMYMHQNLSQQSCPFL